MHDVVCTYFESFDGSDRTPEELLELHPLISLWAQSWRYHGWTPVVLTPEDAAAHSRSEDFERTVAALPTVNAKLYEAACFRRWVAAAARGIRLMTDYDVLNYGVRPDDVRLARTAELPQGMPIVLDRGRTPCAVLLPSDEARSLVVDTILDPTAIERATILVEGHPHVSDMTLFQETSLGRVAPLCDLHTSGLSLRHFSSDTSGGPSQKGAVMREQYDLWRRDATTGPRRSISTAGRRIAFLYALAEARSCMLPGEGQQDLALQSEAGSIASRRALLGQLRDEGPERQGLWELVSDRLVELGVIEGLTGGDVWRLLLMRVPGAQENVEAYSPDEVLRRILSSYEFQTQFPTLVKSTLGRGQWCYFAHIPKTAGSLAELTMNLDREFGQSFRVPMLPMAGEMRHPYLLAKFAEAMLGADDPRPFISGHVSLFSMVPQQLRWPGDRMSTVVREPLHQMISFINYYVDRASSGDEDDAGWWRALGLEPPAEGGAVPVDAVIGGVAAHLSLLLPSTYVRSGESLVESILANDISVGRSESISDYLELEAPVGLARVRDIGVEKDVNVSTHSLSLEALSLPQRLSLARTCAPLLVEHAEVRAAQALRANG